MILEVRDLVTGYEGRKVLNEVNLGVDCGSVLVVLGQNGSGKSTLLKAIFGLQPIWSGRITVAGQPLEASPSDALSRGIAYLPQGARVFTMLTVEENLAIAREERAPKRPANVLLDRFPILQQRLRARAGDLSGGEQQMLSLAMVLSRNPRVLLLDEPSLGLAEEPLRMLFDQIRAVAAESNVAVMMAEQRAREALRVADRYAVINYGRITSSGDTSTMAGEFTFSNIYAADGEDGGE